MAEQKPMEMIRIPAKEQVFDREAVLGRGTASVFPKQAAKEQQEGRANAFRALFGDDKRFITESELREIQESAEKRDGSLSSEAQKPLAEILREAKEKKEQTFQEGWKQMKTGKNRPLDAEELEFFDSIAAAEVRSRKRQAEEETAELDAFRRAREETQGIAEEEDAGKAAPQAQPLPPPDGERASLWPAVADVDAARPSARKRRHVAAVIVRPQRPDAVNASGASIDREAMDDEEQPTLGGLLSGYGSD